MTNKISVRDFQRMHEKKKSKYNATPTIKNEIRFDSKLEATYYEWLCHLLRTKKIRYFLRQVPFTLPGKVRYIVDFQICMNDGQMKYVDVKGMMTDISRLKIKQVHDLYPVEIEIVDKHEMKRLNASINFEKEFERVLNDTIRP